MNRIERANVQVLEPLEARTLLSGNVTAVLRNGSLTLSGDADDNGVVVWRTAGGSFRVSGQDGTTVNGKMAVTVGSVTHDVTIQMKQGGTDDVVVSGPLQIPGSLDAALGGGELLLDGSVGPLTVGGNVSARAGADGVVNLRNEVVVGGKLTINSGGDANVVSGAARLPDFAAARFSHGLTINNPYSPLVVGTTYTYANTGVDPDTDQPFTERNTVEVTPETRVIAGVTTRVVRDRVFRADGKLSEDTRDHFAQDDNGNVWYFGEDTETFEYDDRGNLVSTSTEGSWTAGVDHAQAGIIMEAAPRAGNRYYQEFGPVNNVLDTGVGLATTNQIRVPAGRFRNVFVTSETSAIEPLDLASKYYAPGVGTILEIAFDPETNAVVETDRLVSVTLNGKAVSQVVSSTGFRGANAAFARTVGPVRVGGAAAVNTGGAFAANQAVFNGAVDITSGAEDVIMDSDLNGAATIASPDSAALRGVFADGTVRVNGPSDLFVFRSQVPRLEANFGRIANTLIVQDSIIGTLNADGGRGQDTFQDRGGNIIDQLNLTNFEQTV
jgi:hypothetical protein